MDSEYQRLFEESLERFSADNYSHAKWREYSIQQAGYCPDMWVQMAEMGWLGLISKNDDFGGTLSDLVPMFVSSGQYLWREPLISVLAESAAILELAENTTLAASLLAGISSGDAIPVYAHKEAELGWEAGPLMTVARPDSDAFLLFGTKTYVLGGSDCTGYLVSATSEVDGVEAVYYVDADAEGVVVDSFRTIDDRVASSVTFHNTPAQFLASGPDVLAKARGRAMILACAETVGVMTAVLDATVEYLKSRKQFGRALSTFQVLQHRLVEMKILLVETTATLKATATAFDEDAADVYQRVLMLRAQSARAGKTVTQEAIQMHGGMGMTSEMPVGDYYKRILMLEGLCGSETWALNKLTELAPIEY